MEKEIKVRKKRFMAFWLAALVICSFSIPMLANAVDNADGSGVVAVGDQFTAGAQIRAQSITYLNSDGQTLQTGIQGSGGWQNAIAYPAENLPAGKRFLYWEVSAVSADKTTSTEPGYTDGVAYPVSVTLRPVLEEIRYTITFDTAGGGAIDPIVQAPGTAVTAPADPVKAGYTFTGWDTAIPATMPEQDMTITAQWTVNRYTITFVTDGGTEIVPIQQDYGTAITAPADPTRGNDYFMGWDKAIPTTMPAENVTITAKWTPYVIDAGTYDMKQGVEYKLGSATKVSGDSSTYVSGSVFYVPADGSYTFS